MPAETPLEQALEFLKLPSKDGDSGLESSLFDHLANVILRILEEKPENALEVFEEVSRDVRKSSVAIPGQEPSEALTEDGTTLEQLNKVLALFNNTKQSPPSQNSNSENEEELEEDEEEVPESSYNDEALPALVEEARLLSDCGVAFADDQEVIKLLFSLRKLTASHNVRNIRFFGRFLAALNDYYVVEAECDERIEIEEETRAEVEEEEEEGEEEEEEEVDNSPFRLPPVPKAQPQAKVEVPSEVLSGPNTHAYFVATSVCGPWTQLPEVSAAQIVAARGIRKNLTGELSSEVKTFPAFPGNEANYLRAQIARIAASTIVAPRGFFTTEVEDEEDDDIVPEGAISADPDFVGSAEEMESTSGWVHSRQYLLPQGRTVWWSAKEQEDEEDEEEEDADEVHNEEAEEGPSILTGLDEDASIAGAAAWSVRASAGIARFSAHYVKSLVWPGATSIHANGRVVSVYVGTGLKSLGAGYTPQLPTTATLEYAGEDLVEESDPTAEDEKSTEVKLDEEEQSAEDDEGDEDEEDEDY